jgi:hypothetical protein
MLSFGRFFLALALACGLAQGAAAQSASLKSVEVQATEFKVTLTDGRVLRSKDLVGARLVIAMGGQALRVRIDGVEPDPDAANGEVWLHTFSAELADGTWQNVCDPGPDGRRQGFPVAGRPRADGMLEPAEPGVFELACTSGALGKCIRFGYRPWAFAQGLELREVYNACIRMVRADYCGNGTPTTKDGQSIDIYDDHRIQKPENDPAMDFEAGWSADGAVCVRHVRVKENVSLESLVATCPRLKDRVGPTCSEETARRLGARLFNRSRP